MVDYSYAPYQFFEPRPWRPLLALAPAINRWLLRFDHKIHQTYVSGQFDRVRELIARGDRVLFTPNHPSRTDPQLVGRLCQQLGRPASFMAAYDVFLENKMQAWLMQRTGSFSIDREGNDRKSMMTAIDVLKKGAMSLTIFPEGNVFHLNDRVTPLLDGPSFIGIKAQQALAKEEAAGGSGRVWIVPISIKYTHLTDVADRVWRQLSELAQASGYDGELDPEEPGRCVFQVGTHLLSKYLSQHGAGMTLADDFAQLSPPEIRDRLMQIAQHLIAGLESDLALETNQTQHVVDRIRSVRASLYQQRHATEDATELERLQEISDRSIFAFRLLAYILPYFTETPSLDRYAETVARLHEDYFSTCPKPLGPRAAYLDIREPIDVSDALAQAGGKAKAAIPALTQQIESSIQAGVDEINARITDTAGVRLVEA